MASNLCKSAQIADGVLGWLIAIYEAPSPDRSNLERAGLATRSHLHTALRLVAPTANAAKATSAASRRPNRPRAPARPVYLRRQRAVSNSALRPIVCALASEGQSEL